MKSLYQLKPINVNYNTNNDYRNKQVKKFCYTVRDGKILTNEKPNFEIQKSFISKAGFILQDVKYVSEVTHLKINS